MRIPGFAARALQGDQPLARMLRPVINRVLSKEPTRVTIMSGVGAGLKLVIDPQLEKFYWTGSYEPAVQQAIGGLLSAGDVFWDVGAHVGFYSVIASRLVGPSGFVHAFEPFESNVTRLRTSLAMNRAKNVTVHSVAISDQIGEAMLYRADLSVMATLNRERGISEAAMVSCTTLDAMAVGLGTPSLIKIDVEGAEERVIAGGADLLAQCKVTLVVEFLTDSAVERARSQLPSYQFERLDGSNWLVRPRS